MRKTAVNKRMNLFPKIQSMGQLLAVLGFVFSSIFLLQQNIAQCQKAGDGETEIPQQCPMKFMTLWLNLHKGNLYHLSEVGVTRKNLHTCIIGDQKEILQCKSKRE